MLFLDQMKRGFFIGGSRMRFIKRMLIISLVFCVLLITCGSNVALISECIWELMNALIPVVIVLIGIMLVIRSVF